MHCIHLSRFLVPHPKIFVPYIILCTARLSLFHTESLFSPLKYIVYRCYSCFRQRGAQFFHRHTCIQWLQSFSLYNVFVYTCHAFLVLHQKIFVPYIILFTARLSLFHTESLFSPLKYIVYRCYSCFRQRRGHFFHRHTCIQWLHSFSLYNAFVYTCHAFLVHHQKIFVPYIILCTARLSLFHTESLFSPLKYIVYSCYSCFRQRGAQFFHRHTCIQWLHSFSLYNAFVYTCHAFLVLHQKIFVPYIILCTARLSLFHTESLFSPLKYIVYRCYSCFRQRRAQFFHRHTCIQWLHSFSLYNALYTLVTLFWCFIRKYLSHTLYCAQPVSVCFTLNLCFLL